MTRPVLAIVLGAGGYVGGEMLRLIASHPSFELHAAISDRRHGQSIVQTFPHISTLSPDTAFTSFDSCLGRLSDCERLAVFSAAPHGAAAAMIDKTLTVTERHDSEVHCVDCSADFRFSSKDVWESIYNGTHDAPKRLSEFSSAVPEHQVGTPTDHVGHPGCFATAMLLATVPLLHTGLLQGPLFISGVTGSTGSGREPKPTTHHPERHGNLYAYQPLVHRHVAEVETLCQAATRSRPNICFVPHSGPFSRGIHVTLQAATASHVSPTDLYDLYTTAYSEEPFVQLVSDTPRLKNIVGSNYCQLSVSTNGEFVVVTAVIDNLIKGAAGGAMQWMNRLFALPETAGLQATSVGWS